MGAKVGETVTGDIHVATVGHMGNGDWDAKIDPRVDLTEWNLPFGEDDL